MNGVLEKIRSVPAPLWIGALLIVVLAIFVTRRSGSAGAITGATTGSPGAASGGTADNSQAIMSGFASLQTNFNSGLKQIVDVENKNNANTLTAFTSMLQQMTQDEAQRTAALQTGMQTGFQQLATAQQQQNQSTLAAITQISQGFSSSMTSFGQALQALRSDLSHANNTPQVIYVGGQASDAHVAGGGSGSHPSSQPSDSGSHMALVNGQVTTINKPYSDMTDAERGAANDFAHHYPNGLNG